MGADGGVGRWAAPPRFYYARSAADYREFVHAYNHHHWHFGIGMHTPPDVRYRLADAIDHDRDAALETARAATNSGQLSPLSSVREAVLELHVDRRNRFVCCHRDSVDRCELL